MPPLSFPIENRGLFSDHYLDDRFPERDDVQALADEADAAFERVCDLYRQAAAAADLDAQIAFTDRLIDQIVYRLYGLSEEEVAVVEG